MTDRASTTPENVIPLNRARLCAEDHVYDTSKWNGCCPCGTEQGVMLEEILDVGKAPARSNATEARKRG